MARIKMARLFLAAAAAAVFGLGTLLALRPDIQFKCQILLNSLFDSGPNCLAPVSYPEDALTSYTLGEAAEAGFEVEPSLLLVNEVHPLSEEDLPAIGEYEDSGVEMAFMMMEAYTRLKEAVSSSAGERLLVSSSLRDSKEQAALYNEDPRTAAPPGTSEHELGLALDVYTPYFAGEAFLKSKAGQFVNTLCGEYGFIIRYPFLKEKATGIPYEPWHIRYVGSPHAQIIMENGLCLEEYIESLEPGRFYKALGYLITRQKGDTFRIPDGLTGVRVSPDNTGCLIVTGRLAGKNNV